jgi:hypothetical protein
VARTRGSSDAGAVTLLTELDAFYVGHRRCGELEAGVDGPTVWFDCECRARIADVLTTATYLTSTLEPPHHPRHGPPPLPAVLAGQGTRGAACRREGT